MEIIVDCMTGLCDCRWPGRYQVLHRKNVVYFLDGAHTPESMEV